MIELDGMNMSLNTRPDENGSPEVLARVVVEWSVKLDHREYGILQETIQRAWCDFLDHMRSVEQGMKYGDVESRGEIW